MYSLCEAQHALTQARQMKDSDPLNACQLQLETVLHIKQRHGNAAMDTFQQLLETYPDVANDPVGLANLGVIFVINQDYARAVSVLELVPRKHPVWQDQAASWLAEAYSLLGKGDAAVSLMQEICREEDLTHSNTTSPAVTPGADPTRHCAVTASLKIKNWSLWGAALCHLGRHEEAVSVLQRAAHYGTEMLGPLDAITRSTQTTLGLALMQCKDRASEAEATLRCAVSERAMHSGDRVMLSAVQALVTLCEARKDAVGAAQYAERLANMTWQLFQHGTASVKEVVDARWRQAQCLVHSGDHAEAITVAHRYLPVSSDADRFIETCTAALGKGHVGDANTVTQQMEDMDETVREPVCGCSRGAPMECSRHRKR